MQGCEYLFGAAQSMHTHCGINAKSTVLCQHRYWKLTRLEQFILGQCAIGPQGLEDLVTKGGNVPPTAGRLVHVCNG